MTAQSEKAVCYVQHDGHLLVFTHLDVPMTITGVQVPAGTVDAGERPEDAAVRELKEETGLDGRLVRSLGTEVYDVRPTRDQIATRHFFELTVQNADVSERWVAGEDDPNGGGAPLRWECWWLPLEYSQVLVAGLGAKLGALVR